MIFIILAILVSFVIIFVTLRSVTKKPSKDLICYILIAILLLLFFGQIDTAIWGLLSAIFALLLHFVSNDFLFTLLKIENNNRNKYKLFKIKSKVLIFTPLIFLSMYLVTPDRMKSFNNDVTDSIQLYKLNEPNKIELFYKNDYLKANYISYSFSKKPYIEISKFKDSSKQEKEFTRLIEDSDLVAFDGAKEFKVTYITLGNEKDTVWLELYSNNNNDFFNFLVNPLLISIFRFYLIISLFPILIVTFDYAEQSIFKSICEFFEVDEKIRNIQGHWYQEHKYVCSKKPYYLSTESFSIKGYKLFYNDQQYDLKLNKNKILFQPQKKNKEIDYLENSSEIKIGDSIFKNKKSIKIKKFKHPKKSKKLEYYRLDNQNNFFEYPKYEHVLCLDVKNNELIETRTGDKFKFKNNGTQNYLEHKNITFESNNDTLLFYNQNKECLASYKKMEKL
jgi:membrane protein